jgi:hypothetical protein
LDEVLNCKQSVCIRSLQLNKIRSALEAQCRASTELYANLEADGSDIMKMNRSGIIVVTRCSLLIYLSKYKL